MISFNPGRAQRLLNQSDGDVVAAGYWLAVDLLQENPELPDGHVVFHAVHQLCKELNQKTPNPDDVQLRLKQIVQQLAPH